MVRQPTTPMLHSVAVRPYKLCCVRLPYYLSMLRVQKQMMKKEQKLNQTKIINAIKVHNSIICIGCLSVGVARTHYVHMCAYIRV